MLIIKYTCWARAKGTRDLFIQCQGTVPIPTQHALIPDRADTAREWVNLMSFLDYIINFDEMIMQSSYQQLKHELPQVEHQSNHLLTNQCA